MLWVYVNNNFRGYRKLMQGITWVLKGSLDKEQEGAEKNRLIDIHYN